MKHILVLFSTILLLTSCSENPTSVARKNLELLTQRDSKGFYKLLSFEKTDGIEGNKDGVASYSLKYNAEIECLKEGGWYGKDVALDGYPLFVSTSPTWSNYHDDFDKGHYKHTTKTGEKFKLSGDITLLKHEQGWVVEQTTVNYSN